MHGQSDNSEKREDGQIVVRPFKVQDMLDVIAKGIMECNVRSDGSNDLRELAEARESSGTARTGMIDGEVAGCAGVDLLWPGVGEIWLLLSHLPEEKSVAAVLLLKRWLSYLINENKLHRLQCHVRCDFAKAVKLVEYMGFQSEGIARQFTHDKMDCISYAITR